MAQPLGTNLDVATGTIEYVDIATARRAIAANFESVDWEMQEGTHHQKSKQMAFKEVVGLNYRIMNTDLKEMANFLPADILAWAKCEFLERIAGEQHINPGSAWRLDSEAWDKLRESDGRFSYTYNERYMYVLEEAIRKLKTSPTTRQALVPVFLPEDTLQLSVENRRVPCTVFCHFIVRDEKLNMLFYSRSNNFGKFWQTDLFLHAMLLHHVADRIEVEVGYLQHTVGSMHLIKGGEL